jgi:hypothetical protein
VVGKLGLVVLVLIVAVIVAVTIARSLSDRH